MHGHIKHALFTTATPVIVALLMSTQAYADDQRDGGAATDAGGQTFKPGDIVVTAQRRGESMQKVPIAMQVLSADTLSKLGIRNSADIAQTTPNVSIGLPNGAGNQPVITIRGIGLATYDTKTAGPNGVYLDGVYISSPSAQSFQIFDLQRIEVLKGPQGTLYGRNATGGAINFITAKPNDMPSGHLHVEYSSFNTLNVEAALGGPLSDTVSARIAGVYNTSAGFLYNELYNRHENGTRNFAARAEIKWQPSPDFSAMLTVNGGSVRSRPTEYRHVGVIAPGGFNPATFAIQFCSQQDAMAGNCVDMFGYGTNANFYHGSWNRSGELKSDNASAALQLDLNTGPIKWESITSYQYSTKQHPEDSDASPYNLLEIDYGLKSWAVTQEFHGSYTADRFNILVGAYGFQEVLRQDQPLTLFYDFDKVFGAGSGDGLAAISNDRARQSRLSGALFSQADYNVTDKLKLTFGGRLTSERQSFTISSDQRLQDRGLGNYGPVMPLWSFGGLRQTDTAFDYRAVLNYQVRPTILLYGGVTTGFKSGDYNGGFLSTNVAEATRQVQAVKPEKVRTYEVGLKSTFLNNRVRLNLAAFYNDYRNQQVFVILPPIPGGSGLQFSVLDNAPKSRTEGIEGEFVVNPTKGLTVTTNAAVLSAKIVQFSSNRSETPVDYSGNTLPLSPKFSLSQDIDYRVPVGSNTAWFNLSANYRSTQHFDLSNQAWTSQEGYWLVNGRVAYQFEREHIEVAVFARNIFDKKYLTFANDNTNPFGFIEDIVGAPRSIGASIDYKF